MNAFMYAKARESIETFGFLDPLTVRPRNERFELIDGEHRWQVGTELGMSEFPAFCVEGLTDAQAKRLTIIFNELHGQVRPDLLTELLKDIEQEVGLDELRTALPYPDEVLGGLMGMKLEPLNVQSALASPITGEETKTRWVEKLYRMPADVAEVLDQAIVRAQAEHDLKEPWQGLEVLAAEYLAT